jgi:DNA-binding response OmpR family regulator
MADVWDAHWHGSTKTLDVHVASLRRTLEMCAAGAGVTAPVIETLRGFGYRVGPGSEDDSSPRSPA